MRRLEIPLRRRAVTMKAVAVSTTLLVVVTGVGIQQAGNSGLFASDESGRPVATSVAQAAAMERPTPEKGVKLGKPATAPVSARRKRPPLKATKSCDVATDLQVVAGIEKGSRVCVLSETRQSPQLVHARPLIMAEGFEAAPEPTPVPSAEPSEEPRDDASATPVPSSSASEPTGPAEPSVGPSGSPSPSQPEPTGLPEEADGSRAPPTPEPTLGHEVAPRIAPAAFHPKDLDESAPGEYLSPNWTQLHPISSPAAKLYSSMVYDQVRHQFVLFGGYTGTSASNETWVWSGTDWVKLNPVTSPPARYGASMAWDDLQKKVVLFGGRTTSSSDLNDVWSWDGTNWTQTIPAGSLPDPRVNAGFAFDPARGALILFGGVHIANYNDTWQLKNNTWTQIQGQGASAAPPAGNGVRLAYSLSTSQLVLFGGGTGACPVCTTHNETWVLNTNATTWTKWTPEHSPSPRGNHSMVYDPGMRAVVLFGGTSGDGTTTTLHNDTWAWTGTDWAQAVGIASPSGRSASAMASDDKGHTLLVGGTGPSTQPETWTYETALPVVDVEVTNASGGTEANPVFWVGDSATVTVTVANGGVSNITANLHTAVTAALDERLLAAGTQITWRSPLDPPEDKQYLSTCGTAVSLCAGVSGLSTTISNIEIPGGSTRIGEFVATVVGSQRGCELVDIPVTVSSGLGASNDVFSQITVCGGGLGLENWWTYDTTDLGNGGTASVNAANGNLVVKQYDTAPVQTRGRLALGLGRAYNSQDLMTSSGPIGAGWQFDIGDTGEAVGGMGIAGFKLPNLQNIKQPLSMPYVDRDGTRHVFRLRSVGVAAGGINLPVDLSSGAGGVVAGLLGGLDNLPFKHLLSGDLTRLCIDQAYTGPKGSNMFLFRYLATASADNCAAPGTNALGMGWSLVRPDRLRYDFDLAGNLIQVTDPAGQQLIYGAHNQFGPTEIYTKACGNAGVCPKITIDYDAPGASSNFRHVKVTDSAGRITSYLVTKDAFMPELKQVWLPGNPLSDSPHAKPSIRYSYTIPSPQSGKAACDDKPNVVLDSQTLGQLCSVTDAQDGRTTFAYTAAATVTTALGTTTTLGPDRVLKVTDRRGNVDSDGAAKGLATLYGWHDKTDGSPDFVTADMAAAGGIGNCAGSAACQRIRYTGIDAYGRVGVIEEGAANDIYLRQTGYFWDSGTEESGIASCSQPAGAVNHNLCEVIRRAVPRTTPFVPGQVQTGTVNGVTVHDQAVDYLYGDLGQKLRQRVLLDSSQPWTDANSSITTWGTLDQYFDANGEQRAYNSHVEGNGVVESTGAGVKYGAAVKSDAPVAYWRLDEDPGATQMKSVDGTHAVGYVAGAELGDSGAVQGSTGLVEKTTGVTAAVGSLQDVPHGTTPEDSDFTIESWQRTTDTGQEYLFHWGVTAANGMVGRAAGARPMIMLRHDAANNYGLTVYSNASIGDGNWHHVVYTYDGSKTAAGASIWIDGIKQSLTVYSDVLAGEYAAANSYSQFFYAGPNSHVDELSLFGGVLSNERIKAHYDASNGGNRVQSDTLYAVTDQTQELSPRGNSTGNWGEHLTSIRRDVPAQGSSASTFTSADANGICGGNATGNTGVVCEVDTPASNGTPPGSCQSPVAAPPGGSATPPTSAGFAYSCTKYTYNSSGQRTVMRTPKSNSAGIGGTYNYTYYDGTDTCAGAGQANCDLSGTVSAGGWLKAVSDPVGEKTVFSYDAAGNVARTWERNATHGHALSETWTSAGAAPTEKFVDQVYATPVTSDSLSVSNFALISVAPDGTVAGAGLNALGELGDGTTTARPNRVTAKGLSNVVKVSQSSTGGLNAGACTYDLFLTGNGDVWSAGRGASTPSPVTGLTDIIDIHAAGCHAMALDASGNVFTWGTNTSGQIGNGKTDYQYTPTNVLSNVSAISGGYRHSLAVKTDGTVWAWGHNGAGELGLGDNSDRATPTKIAALKDVRGLGAGLDTSYAIGRDGKVWAWGEGQNGGLGLGNEDDKNTPTQITTLGQGTAAGLVREVEGSAYGAAALMADGTIRAWGLNNYGQVGANSMTPVAVSGLTGQVALAGGWTTYASADKAGQVKVWGSTGNYQRADGTNPTSSTPVAAGLDISPYRLPGLQPRGARDATGNLMTTTYDRLERPKRVRSGRGNDILSSAFDRMVGYDAAGRPTWVSGAQHRSTVLATTSYDPFGNPTKQVDARGVASLATFDAVNRQLTAQTTRADAAEVPVGVCAGTASGGAWTPAQDGHRICTTSTTWDGVDRQVTLTDSDSQVTKYLADAAGRRTGVDVPRNDGATTYVKSRWLLDKDGNTTTFCPPRQIAEDASGACVSNGTYAAQYLIDRAGRTIAETRHRGATELVTSFGFDADGNPTSVTDPNGHTTTQAYDLQGRLLSRSVPRSANKSFTSTWAYDYTGNVTSVRGPGSLNTGSGADGDLVVDGLLGINSTDGAAHGSGSPFKVPDGAQYRNVTLQNGAYLTANDANGLMFSATGTVTVCTNCQITMVGKGYAGGAANQDAANPNPGNGGKKGVGTLLAAGSGGGGGGHKSSGASGVTNNSNVAGIGGLSSGTADFSDVGTAYLRAAGGGGGSGGAGLLGSSAKGGNGGGYIRITATKIVVAGNGVITAAGVAGTNGGTNSGGGGGGAGGGLWLAAQDISLNATTSLSVAGGNGGTGSGGNVGGNGSIGYLRIDTDTITNEPANADRTSAAMVTAVSYDAANRPVDTVEGAQTVQANPYLDSSEFAVPDANGMANTRTRSIYNADGAVAAVLPPTAFSDAASLTAPNVDVARRVDYDLDGRVARTYSPRYSDTTTSIGSGNDGTSGTNQQVSQCTTSRTIDAVADIKSYGSSVGVCATASEYDPVGNVARQWLPSSNGSDTRVIDYAYTDDNLVKSVTGPDPNGAGSLVVSRTRYDGTGNPIRVEDAVGNATLTSYTGDDLVSTIVAPSYTDGSGVTVASTTTYDYDANGNTVKVRAPSGNGTVAETTQAWTSDNLVSQISAPGASSAPSVTKYSYDKVGNPTEVYAPETNAQANPKPVVNEYTWDNLISATHTPLGTMGAVVAAHRSVKYTYSGHGLKIATETARCNSGDTSACTPTNGAWASAGTMRLTYGANGRVADQIGRDKSSISTTYTQDGQAKKITDPTSGITVTAGYYLDGSVRTVDDGANANTYAYDGAGQVTVRTDKTPATGLTAGATVTTSYGYNAAGLPTSMDSGVLDQTTTYAYDDAGRLDTATTGDHVNDLSWNPDNSLAEVRNIAGSTMLSDYVYRYYDSGNIKSQAVTGSIGAYTDTYEYAPGNQLTKWTSGGVVTSYQYDENSNREKVTVGTTVTDWTYNRDNSIAAMKQTTPEDTFTKSYTYNNAGLQTSDGCSTTSYDDFDRVSKVEVGLLHSTDEDCGKPDQRVTTYAYDGLDRQRSSAVTGSTKSGANVTTKSIFDGLTTNTVGQTDAVSGARTSPEIMYQLDPSGEAMGYEQTGDSNAHKAFLDTDGQGNVTTLVTTAGANACSVHYDPFGSGTGLGTPGTDSNGLCKDGSKATSTGNSLWYRGAVRDGSVRTYQFGTRTYNPATGAFTSPDSYRVAAPSTDLSVGTDPLTMNSYSYVNGNPLNMWDPSGHRPVDADGDEVPYCDWHKCSKAQKKSTANEKRNYKKAKKAMRRAERNAKSTQAASKPSHEITGPGSDVYVTQFQELTKKWAELLDTRADEIAGAQHLSKVNKLVRARFWRAAALKVEALGRLAGWADTVHGFAKAWFVGGADGRASRVIVETRETLTTGAAVAASQRLASKYCRGAFLCRAGAALAAVVVAHDLNERVTTYSDGSVEYEDSSGHRLIQMAPGPDWAHMMQPPVY